MEERNMTISIAQARKWFNSGNHQLALQVFDRKDLTFRHIVTFKDACEVLSIARIRLLELSVDPLLLCSS